MNKKFLCLTLADQVTVNGSSGYNIYYMHVYNVYGLGDIFFSAAWNQSEVSELQPVLIEQTADWAVKHNK